LTNERKQPVSEANFRRKLKHILKNWQRKDMNSPEGYKKIVPKLMELGYVGLPYDIICVLRKFPKAKGRALARIGRAALKRGKVADLFIVSLLAHIGFDLRHAEFHNVEESLEELYEI